MFHILWKLPWPLTSFCTGSPEPMFHFAKASISPSFILHRVALANVSFCESFPCSFSHSAPARLGQCFQFYESFPGPFSHSSQVCLSQGFILWKLPWPIFSFCAGSPWPRFYFVKASIAPSLILHRFAWVKFSFCERSIALSLILHRLAWAKVSFCKSFPTPFFILHRFAWDKFSFYESLPGPFSHSAQVRLIQSFILWKLSLPTSSFCAGSPEPSFHLV